ncbi:MAG: hypothetical protein CMQ71_00365 [Gammaproteobacteria bacterium]|nr:hypothetical protein [Gammaproteobacteria bacterium]
MALSKDQKKIYKLIKKDDCKHLSELLKIISDKYFSDDDKGTPIQYAIKKNNLPACEILIENSYPIETFDNCGTAILSALLNSNIDALDLLVANGAKIDTPLQKQSTTYALTYSYYVQDFRFAKKLLELGASSEVMSEIKLTNKDSDEITDKVPAVFAAAQTGNIDIFELAIENAKNFISEKGISLFWHLLVPDDRSLDQYQNRAIKIMIEKGVPLSNSCSEEIEGVGKSAFTLLFKRNLEKREKIVREKLIFNILDDQSRIEEHANIPLAELIELSAYMGSKKLIKHFLEKGGELELKKGHFSALHQASMLRDSGLSFEITNLLIKKITNKDIFKINFLDDAGKSAFELAVQYNNYDTASLLVDSGAKIVSKIDSDDEIIPLWVQLVSHIHDQTDVDRLEKWIDRGLKLPTFKPQDIDCELNLSSVIAARIVLQNEFQIFKQHGLWKGFYEPSKGFPIVNLSNLLQKAKKALCANSRLEKDLLVMDEIEKIIEEY